MYYVYIIESVDSLLKHYYVGSTGNLKGRLADHSAGSSPHTAKYRPWMLVWYCAFSTRAKAEAFERYLKTASGGAFQKKRIEV
jgi:predicted GIY-YIG superfamily endonuclease